MFDAHNLSFSSKFDFLALLMAQLGGGKAAVVEFLTGRDQVENNARQFVGGGGDGLGSTQFGSHTPIEAQLSRSHCPADGGPVAASQQECAG